MPANVYLANESTNSIGRARSDGSSPERYGYQWSGVREATATEQPPSDVVERLARRLHDGLSGSQRSTPPDIDSASSRQREARDAEPRGADIRPVLRLTCESPGLRGRFCRRRSCRRFASALARAGWCWLGGLFGWGGLLEGDGEAEGFELALEAAGSVFD